MMHGVSSMISSRKSGIVLVVVAGTLLAIAGVFCAPEVDLEPTALRAAKIAMFLLAALTLLPLAQLLLARNILGFVRPRASSADSGLSRPPAACPLLC